MPPRSSPPVLKSLSLVERAERLREKMIATAMLNLEDWSPVRAPMPALEGDDVVVCFDPPPVRWMASPRMAG